MDLSLAVASVGARTVLRVAGEVDVSSAPELQDKLADLIDSAGAVLVVDLAGVTFIDSTGLGVLVGARNRASELGGSISVVVTSDRVLKLFRITGLDAVFEVHPSIEAAVAGDAQR